MPAAAPSYSPTTQCDLDAAARSIASLFPHGIDVSLPHDALCDVATNSAYMRGPELSVPAESTQEQGYAALIEEEEKVLQEVPSDPWARSLAASLPSSSIGSSSATSVSQLEWQRIKSEYIGNDRSWHGSYIRDVVLHVWPMDPACELSFCIPVALGQEQKPLIRALQQLAKLEVAPKRCEIVLNLNYPAFHRLKRDQIEPIQSQLSDIYEEAARAHRIPIRFFLQPLLENATIGYIRKSLHDVVLLRHLMRRDLGRDHIMVRTDADITYIDPRYVEYVLRRMAENPLASSLHGGGSILDESAVLSQPALFLAEWISRETALFLFRCGHAPLSGGPNVAMRASAYAQVRGFPTDCEVGEDVGIDKRIQHEELTRRRAVRYLPESEASLLLGSDESTIETSARRALSAMSCGVPMLCQWIAKATTFKLDGAAIRQREDNFTPSPFEFLKAVDTPEFIESAARELAGILTVFASNRPEVANAIVGRVFFPLLDSFVAIEPLYTSDLVTFRCTIQNPEQFRTALKEEAIDRFAAWERRTK